jgi:hypothetical protein
MRCKKRHMGLYIKYSIGLIIIVYSLCSAVSSEDNGPMRAEVIRDESGEAKTITVYREDQIVAVYQRNTQPGRSIANSITELYAIGHKENLLNDSSPLVPPQILARVNDKYNPESCSNEPCQREHCYCDYFVHSNPEITMIQDGGDKIHFKVMAEASQHENKSLPLNYRAEMDITIPYHENYTVIEYDVHTYLDQNLNVGHAVRPMPFFEMVNATYSMVSYLDDNCQVKSVPIPEAESQANGTYALENVTVCTQMPWAALHDNRIKGNLGIILANWSSTYSSSVPVLCAYTEMAHKNESNVYFQSSNHSKLYGPGEWTGKVIFLAYTDDGYAPVQNYRDSLALA